MDHVRVREWARRLEAGEDELDAFWTVASSPSCGLSRFRAQPVRPAPIVLRRKLAALLTRTVPQVVDAARDVALARLAGLSDDAVRAVAEVVTGDFQDGGVARARLDAARVILGSIGLREQPQAAASASLTVSLGDGLRALRRTDVQVSDPGDDSLASDPGLNGPGHPA
jgi:hypothetical protein